MSDWPVVGTKLPPDERKALIEAAKKRGLTVSALAREAIQVYLGGLPHGNDPLEVDDLRVTIPREGLERLRRDAADTNSDHHSYAWAVIYSPRSLQTAYR